MTPDQTKTLVEIGARISMQLFGIGIELFILIMIVAIGVFWWKS